MQNKENVTSAKPGIGGAAFVAPIGTTLPTDAKTPLSADFKALGYISDEGLKNDQKIDSDTIKAWGGDVVLNLYKGKTDVFRATFLEILNTHVLKTVYGKNNVSGDLATMVEIRSNNKELDAQVMVFDMILKGGFVKRVILPDATVTNIDTISYVDSDAVGYGVSINAISDESGDTHIEYIEQYEGEASGGDSGGEGGTGGEGGDPGTSG